MQLMALAFLILVTVVGFQYVGGDTFHQTMVTPVPYGAGLPGVSFSCIRSLPDIYFGYSFGRPFTLNIPGSATGLTGFPNGTISDNTVQNASTWHLPPKVDATGLFHCRGMNPVTGLSSEVYSIIHSHQRKFEPADGQVTKTINKGENATLEVIAVNNGSSPVWHRNNEGILLDLDPTRYKIQLTADEVADGDLFVVTDRARNATLDDNHFGMIRLIVRGCVAGKWGAPDCKGVCDLCYNGGVCDDETGDCICPPGFMGPNCLTACGKHKFGWYCEYECGTNNLIQSCTGSQFGLPDPYGNSCISGYNGTDCDTECPAGTFGAGCTQSCQCQSGACNGFTGECLGASGCSTGWSGTNCQIPDVCPVGYYDVDCLSKCRCTNDTACDKGNGKCVCAPDDVSCLSSPANETQFNVVLIAAIGGGAVAITASLCVALVVCWCARTRRTPRRQRNEQPDGPGDGENYDAPQEHDDVQATGPPAGKYSYAVGGQGWQLPRPTQADPEPTAQIYENEDGDNDSGKPYKNVNPGRGRFSYTNNIEMENYEPVGQ